MLQKEEFAIIDATTRLPELQVKVEVSCTTALNSEMDEFHVKIDLNVVLHNDIKSFP